MKNLWHVLLAIPLLYRGCEGQHNNIQVAPGTATRVNSGIEKSTNDDAVNWGTGSYLHMPAESSVYGHEMPDKIDSLNLAGYTTLASPMVVHEH